jgi:integrase/recombinase XerD
MPLTLYRRHLKSCKVLKLKISARAKRLYIECECPIWMYGRTEKVMVPRQSTGTSDLKVAEAQRLALIANGKDENVHGPTLDDCIERYLASRTHELHEKTLEHHQLLLSRLKGYASTRGVFHIQALTVDLLEDFITDGLTGATTTKSTYVAKLRCFLKDAFRRGWIKEPLAERIKPYKAVYEEKSPYEQSEVELILAESLKMNGGTHGYAKHPATFRLLLELMLETGMRVAAAIMYDPANVVKGQSTWIYRFQKDKSKVTEKPKIHEVFLSERLKKAIDGCTWLSPKLPFHFGNHDADYLANEVYERMKQIGKRCDVEDCRPHRLRDTFAVRCLLRGLTLDHLCRMLGHSSVKVTETYYAKWVPARTRQLEDFVAQALFNTK